MRQPSEQARRDAERGQWVAPTLIVSACPDRGEMMYDTKSDSEFGGTVAPGEFRSALRTQSVSDSEVSGCAAAPLGDSTPPGCAATAEARPRLRFASGRHWVLLDLVRGGGWAAGAPAVRSPVRPVLLSAAHAEQRKVVVVGARAAPTRG